MRTTKVFQSGNSQAVRLPKEFQIEGDRVQICRQNGDIILREIPKNLTRAFELLAELPKDFFDEGRDDSLPQEREF